MILTLYNKTTPIADIDYIFKRGGFINDVIKVHNPEYAPLGCCDTNKAINIDLLSDWWDERCIPDSRKNVEQILEAVRLERQELLINSLGLSLSDQYWVKPVDSDIKWNDVNFFKNEFSDDVGKMFFFEKKLDSKAFRSYSPDYTANGFLNKRWLILNGERILCKSGYGVFNQQPYNEAAASELLKNVGCTNYVEYTMDNKECSLCKDFINEHTEYIPALQIRNVIPIKERTDFYRHFMECCEKIGVKKIMQQTLDYMLSFDYLIANVDRNYGNFGIIRNVETLKIEGVAPIFDNGNSFWYDQNIITHDVKAYPFAFTQNEQIKYVRDYSLFPLAKFKKHIEAALENLSANKMFTIDRTDSIIKAVYTRSKLLEQTISKNMGI